MSETVVLSDEQFVREHWADVEQRGDIDGPVSICLFDSFIWASYPSWSAARAFTEDRLEQIRQIEEEIRWLEPYFQLSATRSSPRDLAMKRILAREQAALAELRRGMR